MNISYHKDMGRKRSKANYFTKETEDYIVAYNNSEDIVYRQKIFTDHIYYPFYKLVENIIHTYKFYYTDVNDIEDLKHEIISILIEDKIMKFDPSRGAKAYSYFGTIVKRWLIAYTDKNYKRLKRVGSFEEINESYEPEIGRTKTGYEVTLSQIIERFIEESYEELDTMFKKDADKKIADAILTLFSKRNDIEIFKKKALYIYIREITGEETPQLTKIINILKKKFYTIHQQYVELDLIEEH